MLLLGARAHEDHPHTGVFVGHGQSHDIPIEGLFLLEVVNVESYVSELCNRRRGHLSSLLIVFRHDAVARWKPYFRTIALKLLDVQPAGTDRGRPSRLIYLAGEARDARNHSHELWRNRRVLLVGEAVVLGRDDLDLEGLFHLSDGALEFDVILVAAIALLDNREALGAEPLFDRIKLSPRFAKARMHLLGREPMIVLL